MNLTRDMNKDETEYAEFGGEPSGPMDLSSGQKGDCAYSFFKDKFR